MIKNSILICLFFLCLFIYSCSKTSSNGLKVIATPVPQAEILEFAKDDLKAKGIDLNIIVVDDYNLPNRSLANFETDANFFQHLPFLEEQVKHFNYPIISIAKVEIEPMGVYSKKITSLSDLKEGSTIAIPNDPTNEGRALLLLQREGLVKVDSSAGLQATVLDINENPKRIIFLEVDAALLARSLEDVEAAIINTNYALEVGLSPLKDALAIESKESPYANVIAVRIGSEKREDIQSLKDVMTSAKMREFILRQYQGVVLPAF